MAIKTQDAVSGFIASEPQLTYGQSGVARFYARMGIEHYRREDDGTFTELEPTFHNLVIYRKTAERANEMFAKGDRFVAEGRVHDYTYTRDGEQVEGEEFIASKIGHDTARSRYTVDRSPRDRTIEREAPGTDRNLAFTAPERPTPAADAPALSR